MSAHFDAVQERTLHAALNRIIPEDAYPGAWEAGCGDYIRAQLDGQLSHLLSIYRNGLDGLDAEAQREFAQSFEALSAEQQDSLLKRIETDDVFAEWRCSPKAFFSTLVFHAAEGYYADPAQGGNRDRISWRMIGFHGK